MAKKFNYFETLEKQGDFAVQEAELLLDIFESFDPLKMPEWLTQMHVLENEADSQIHQILTHLAIEFITPIDREDILSAAQRLDDIVDNIEEVLLQLHMYNITEIHPAAIDFTKLILAATQSLKKALTEFQNFKKSHNQVREYIVEVNDVEEEADRLYAQVMNSLYREHSDDPLYVMIWSNLFAQMEKSVDLCEVIADDLDMIILKNS
ncbi:MAG: DUF47 family protein [Coriobacteriia bacterium]|nr:DUF47 family protein [Coriobacteriia bacterium]MCL2137717.1 DUF47 family protein [Coriobacteriia bacterium]